MKQLNNKGFAISSILYGTLILTFLIAMLAISIMSTNRKNTSTLVSTIEAELNRLSETDTEFQPLINNDNQIEPQLYIVPMTGWYKVELWGAKGESKNPLNGGNGAYTSGIIYLEENDKLYFYIGKKGAASDLRLKTDAENTEESIKSRIMVAGGGKNSVTSANGNDGAGLLAIANNKVETEGQNCETPIDLRNNNGSGYCQKSDNIGGTSYIAGYAGVISEPKSNRNTNFFYNKNIYDENKGEAEVKPTNIHFINGMMIPGINTSENGKATIKKVNDPTTTNNSLSNIRYIKDCIITKNSKTREWSEIEAINEEGINIAKEAIIDQIEGLDDQSQNKLENPDETNMIIDGDITTKINATSITEDIQSCITLDLKEITSLNELAIWHNYETGDANGAYIYNNNIQVSKDKITWNTLQEGNPISIKEKVNGTRYSKYQINPTKNLEEKEYYIFSAETTNKCMSKTGITLFSGNTSQKWKLTSTNCSVDHPCYKIMNVESQKYLTIEGTILKVSDSPTDWVIEKNNSGNYTIRDNKTNIYITNKLQTITPTPTTNETIIKSLYFDFILA